MRSAFKMKGFGGFGNSPLTQKKKPTGPRAEVKPTKNEEGRGLEGSDIPLSPGFEDPIKIQELQRRGLTPDSQNFMKRKKSPLEQTKFPNSPKTKKVRNKKRLAKMDAEYAKGLPARISVDNPEHKGGGDDAWERMQNDHDVDDKGVPQTGAKEYYIKTGTKPKKK